MKLQFLGMKKKGCGSCGGKAVRSDNRVRHTLVGPNGTKVFRKNGIYEFDNEEDYEFYKNYTQRLGKTAIRLFKVID